VVTGIEHERVIEIVEGVKEGDKIVVRGQESLKDRSTIRIVEGS
jgi:multidrug efflux pump subunit AcrA (membrane-fusion protein)